MKTDSFALRHIGPNETDLAQMLQTVGVENLDQLIYQTIPDDIRLKQPLNLPEALSENEFLNHIQQLSQKNKIFKTYIGLGYHETITPSVIKRNIFENPGWYTAYTPYQAEIAQGRLEALLNFQTMVTDLTGMELANASLLDESTAAAEAMTMLYELRNRDQKKNNVTKFFVSEEVLPQTISLLYTRAIPLGIELVIGNHQSFDFSTDFYGALIQYPGKYGQVYDYASFTAKAKNNEIKVAVAADILSLVLLEAPGKWGADVVVGTTSTVRNPFGLRGALTRIFLQPRTNTSVISLDVLLGSPEILTVIRALRMALQTREQHIKRDKATSNICTAQVLLAVMAGMYAVFHGPKGLTYIAQKVHHSATTLAAQLNRLGYQQTNAQYFDTIVVKAEKHIIKPIAEANGVNFLYIDENTISIAVNEATSLTDINTVLRIFAEAGGRIALTTSSLLQESPLSEEVKRKSEFLTLPVFNSYHSETELMRYIKKLERKDLSLNHSMISLGSCTMKLNAASEMLPLSQANWSNIHPFVPLEQAQGYQEMLKSLENQLNIITGFAGTSLQPNSGAQGEYAGLMVIRAYHESRGEGHRHICLIPSSAHGTNPASAVMAGMKVVVTKTDERGNIDVEDLREKATNTKMSFRH